MREREKLADLMHFIQDNRVSNYRLGVIVPTRAVHHKFLVTISGHQKHIPGKRCFQGQSHWLGQATNLCNRFGKGTVVRLHEQLLISPKTDREINV